MTTNFCSSHPRMLQKLFNSIQISIIDNLLTRKCMSQCMQASILNSQSIQLLFNVPDLNLNSSMYENQVNNFAFAVRYKN